MIVSQNGRRIISKWQKAIKEYQEQQVEERKKQQKIDAEDAANKAKDTLKKNRIKKAQWYIDALNKRSYYSNVTKLLIKDGQKALDRLEGYSEYETMKSAFESAVSRAKKLPIVPETPLVPQDPDDNKNPSDDDYPADPTPTAESPVTE